MQNNTKETGPQSSFKAFISYSHADARLVRKLHTQLEAYRLPKGLGEISAQNAFSRDLSSRGRSSQGRSSQGRSSQGLGKIFRDREYLSVAQDLSSTVKDALAQSEVLLVVCSPNAKGSHWVEREIEFFRRLHPNRPILAALVDGEPVDAFPMALTSGGLEPLAADLRKEGDGWKLGFLKLVAGIVDVPLDALVQRDSQRQTTRVMAVTGVVGFFALCMMTMAFVAIQARNEAQFQQAQAEELVAFMMGDLRQELRGVGRLDVMESVNYRALAYFEAQEDPSKLSVDSLAKTAIIRHAIGETELERKDRDLAKAREYFAQAFATTKANLDAQPASSERLFEHGLSTYWMGYHAYVSKDWAQVEALWADYRNLSYQLHKKNPSNPKWVTEAANGESNLCALEITRKGDIELAKQACTAALELFITAYELAPDEPTHIINVANQYAWLGDIHEGQGELAEQRKARLKGERYAEILLNRDIQNRDWHDLWLASQTALAEDEIASGEKEAARSRLKRALPVAEALVHADPENRKWNDKLQTVRELGGKYVRQ